jgi:hypothetical protein
VRISARLRGLLAVVILCCITSSVPVDSCCSLAPAYFSKTKGWVAEQTINGEYVHLLAYQNTMQNLAQVDGKPTGNAMFLPIPAVPGTMTDANMLDTKNCKHILDDMENSVEEYFRISQGNRLNYLSSAAASAGPPAVQVFDRGLYTVVLAKHASDIPGALAKVPANKRPALNEKIFKAYDVWYPEWTFALCCFDNTKAAEADPMLWWYKPKYPKQLFFPALDCHTGEVPELNANVDVDHTLMASSPALDEACDKAWKDKPDLNWKALLTPQDPPVNHPEISYRDWFIPKPIRQLLPKYVTGLSLKQSMRQGDFIINVIDLVKQADSHAYKNRDIWERMPPPGAGRPISEGNTESAH